MRNKVKRTLSFPVDIRHAVQLAAGNGIGQGARGTLRRGSRVGAL